MSDEDLGAILGGTFSLLLGAIIISIPLFIIRLDSWRQEQALKERIRAYDVKLNATALIKESGPCVRIEVSGLRWWQFKARLGLAIVRLGLWIVGVRIDAD